MALGKRSRNRGWRTQNGNSHLAGDELRHMTIVEDEMVPLILKYVKNLDEVNKENGIRAFVWDITDMY